MSNLVIMYIVLALPSVQNTEQSQDHCVCLIVYFSRWHLHSNSDIKQGAERGLYFVDQELLADSHEQKEKLLLALRLHLACSVQVAF